MNWIKALISGIVGGIVVTIYNSLVHGFIMGDVYTKHAVFTQEEKSPLWFFFVAIMIGIFAAILFAKTRGSWAEGIKGGLTFGLFLGMVEFFTQHYMPLVFEGFPYYLSWCWGGINLIGWMLFGVVVGLIYKKA